MNLSIITVQIISKPKLININKKTLIYMSVIVPNEKRDTSFYKLYIYLSSNKYQNFCDLYQIKDIAILTGYLYLRKNCKNILKTYSYMIMKVDEIQPYIKSLK